MAQTVKLVIPPEILLQIVERCDQECWKVLALVSRRWSQAATRQLYHTIRSLPYPRWTLPGATPIWGPFHKGTVINNLQLLHRTVCASPELRSLVVNAYLCWDEPIDAHAGSRPPCPRFGRTCTRCYKFTRTIRDIQNPSSYSTTIILADTVSGPYGHIVTDRIGLTAPRRPSRL